MASTDLDGEPILILSKTEAVWLLAFLNKHYNVDNDSIEFRRVRRKAEEAAQ
jgi:hypothetical protein